MCCYALVPGTLIEKQSRRSKWFDQLKCFQMRIWNVHCWLFKDQWPWSSHGIHNLDSIYFGAYAVEPIKNERTNVVNISQTIYRVLTTKLISASYHKHVVNSIPNKFQNVKTNHRNLLNKHCNLSIFQYVWFNVSFYIIYAPPWHSF